MFDGFKRGYPPVKLVWSQEFTTRDEAKAAEKQVKGWSRKKKFALIRGDWDAVSRHSKAKGSPSTGSGQTDICIHQSVLTGLVAEAAKAVPRECCGILLAAKGAITSAKPAQNIHPTPRTHFEIDPAVLIAAYRCEREGGAQVAGFYHSHPSGKAIPSETDTALAAGDNKIWAIIAGEEVTFWRDRPEGFEALSYRVVDG